MLLRVYSLPVDFAISRRVSTTCHATTAIAQRDTMALSDLITARDALEAKIAAHYAATLHPTHGAGGRSFDHDGHRQALQKELDAINAMIIKRTGTVITRTQVLG